MLVYLLMRSYADGICLNPFRTANADRSAPFITTFSPLTTGIAGAEAPGVTGFHDGSAAGPLPSACLLCSALSPVRHSALRRLGARRVAVEQGRRP